MKRLVCLTVLVAAGACGTEPQLTQPLQSIGQSGILPAYTVARLSTAGPGTAQGGAISNHGVVAGYSGQTDGSRHATLWTDTSRVDLKTLGGINSAVQWPGLNEQGVVVGISQTTTVDPNHESWSCAAFIPATGQTCTGFIWQGNVMTPLPTLGGPNGFAAGINGRGQAVGWAETQVQDPTCVLPQVLQFRAVLWETGSGSQHELPPFPGDSTSAATAINDAGQVVGISGRCGVAVGNLSAMHAVMWDHGQVIDLGNLGGIGWHTPMAINQRGDVVGFSNPPNGDDQADSVRAFLWTRERGIQDLGTLPGDLFSQALGINDRGQVVGVSCAAVCRGFLWQNGVMMDLKGLAGAGFPDDFRSARSINNSGVITGRLRDKATGALVPFVATPH